MGHAGLFFRFSALLPLFFSFVDLWFRYGDHLPCEIGEALMWIASLAFWAIWKQLFFCHGVSMAQSVQHVASDAVSCAKVKRFPKTAPAVSANRAASESFRWLNLNACSSR